MVNWTEVAAVATAIAAVATFCAVAITAWMAIMTRKVAEATEKSAKATENSAKATQQLAEQAEKELTLLEQQTQAIINQAKLSRYSLTQSALPLLVPVSIKEPERITLQSGMPSTIVHPITLTDITGNTLSWGNPKGNSYVISQEDKSVWFIIEMRNIGNGLAVVRNNQQIAASQDQIGGHFYSTALGNLTPIEYILKPQEPVISPGESTLFVGRIEDLDGTSFTSLTSKLLNTHFYYKNISRSSTYTSKVTFSIKDGLLNPTLSEFEGYGFDEIDEPIQDKK